MSNPILIHINRKFHIPLDSIIKIVVKKWGRTWVYYTDKAGQTKIAIAKQDARTLIFIVNQHKIIRGFKPMELIKE